jgi:hypothetical protein
MSRARLERMQRDGDRYIWKIPDSLRLDACDALGPAGLEMVIS